MIFAALSMRYGRPDRPARVPRIVLAAMLLVPAAVFGDTCGEDVFANAYGPFDYTNPEHVRRRLPIVEQHHFNNNVENLVRGQTGAAPMHDLDYVLRAFPNHHRALFAVAKLFSTQKQPPGMVDGRDAECYFARAMLFKPEDATVRMIYGIFLSRVGRTAEALQQYQEALKMTPDSAELNYNIALLYFKQKDYAAANRYAVRAYRLGYPLPGLRNQLQGVGAWDPEKIDQKSGG